MMKFFSRRLQALVFAMAFSVHFYAQSGLVGFANYPDFGLNGTTGGAGGTIVHVDNRADFEKYAGANEPYIIILDATLKGHYDYSTTPKQKHDFVSVKSNKTIIGGGAGAHLDCLGLDINGEHNIIIRNLRITKADPDALAFRNAHHVWVDHCDLSSQKKANEANDGLLDFTYGSSYLTVSWCRFHDHDKSSICSSGTRNINDYGRQRVTYHHNAFINCTQRNPRIGYGLGHIFNDYNEKNTSYAIGMFARAVVNVENCYFKNVNEAFNQMYAKSAEDAYWGFVKSENNIFESTNGSKAGNSDGFDVSRYYDYDFALDKATDVPGLVASMGCTEGVEGDIIPFPGDGANGVTADMRISCGDIESATAYSYAIGTSADVLQPCDPSSLTLQPGTTYFWRVTVVGGRHDGTVSPVFRFTTAQAKASCPMPLDNEQHASLREIKADKTPCVPLTLRWRDAFDAAGYTVYVGTRDDLSNAVAAQVSTTAYAPGGLRHGVTYYWRVDTHLGNGAVVEGDVWQFKSDAAEAYVGRNEAESAVLGAFCFPEYEAPGGWIAASNDRCVVGDEGPGYMSFVWAGESGVYDLTTAYFDETSGQSWFGLYVNETQKDRWTATANNNKMAHRQTKGVTLQPGDELRLEFCTDSKMRCRTDYIDIAASSEPSGIMDITADDTASSCIYTIDGRYAGNDIRQLGKGVYIINRKKVVVR